MLYGKKSVFLRKITSKIVGNSSHKRKGDKCHTVPKAPSSHHHQEGKNGGRDGQPLLIAMTHMAEKGMSPSIMDQAIMSPVTNTAKISGLLAAKLKCDEWGLQSRTQATPPSRKVVSSGTSQAPTSSPKRRSNRQQRKPAAQVNNKVHHPSYKPPMAQRSASMKERREAMESDRKYHNLYFSSSLYRIDEVDEKGLE